MNEREKKRADDLDRAFLPVAWFILIILVISFLIGYDDYNVHLRHYDHTTSDDNAG